MIFGQIWMFMGYAAWMDFVTGAWLSQPCKRKAKEVA